MKQITKEWLVAANDDLLIIKEIIDMEYLTHLVAFHAQQSLEKSLKALMEEFFGEVPRVHNLVKLSTSVSAYISLDTEKEFELLEELDKLYIDARYPGDMGLLPSGKPTIKEAENFYDFALYLYNEVKNILD